MIDKKFIDDIIILSRLQEITITIEHQYLDVLIIIDLAYSLAKQWKTP